MVLGEGIEDANGARHAMTGLLAHSTSFAKRKLHLGYREARLRAGSPLGPMGAVVRGHEFHYATLSAAGSDETLAELADAQGRDDHISGEIAKALFAKAEELFVKPPMVEQPEIVAAKTPGA